MYEEEEFNKLKDLTPPEMIRSDLSSAVLNLMALGIGEFVFFQLKH